MVVRRADPLAAALVQSQFLATRGDVLEAERLLLEHSDAPDALQLLAGLAARREDWERSLLLTSELLRRAPTNERRLLYVEVARRAGRTAEAASELAALRSDPSLPSEIRARAYALSAEQAWNIGEFEQVMTVTDAWLSVAPDNPTAAWARVHALTRIGKFADAARGGDQPRPAGCVGCARSCCCSKSQRGPRACSASCPGPLGSLP